jgi:hypothetical protein
MIGLGGEWLEDAYAVDLVQPYIAAGDDLASRISSDKIKFGSVARRAYQALIPFYREAWMLPAGTVRSYARCDFFGSRQWSHSVAIGKVWKLNSVSERA